MERRLRLIRDSRYPPNTLFTGFVTLRVCYRPLKFVVRHIPNSPRRGREGPAEPGVCPREGEKGLPNPASTPESERKYSLVTPENERKESLVTPERAEGRIRHPGHSAASTPKSERREEFVTRDTVRHPPRRLREGKNSSPGIQCGVCPEE